jgi:hypothetical protein
MDEIKPNFRCYSNAPLATYVVHPARGLECAYEMRNLALQDNMVTLDVTFLAKYAHVLSLHLQTGKYNIQIACLTNNKNYLPKNEWYVRIDTPFALSQYHNDFLT